jgi:hypothetical protein
MLLAKGDKEGRFGDRLDKRFPALFSGRNLSVEWKFKPELPTGF